MVNFKQYYLNFKQVNIWLYKYNLFGFIEQYNTYTKQLKMKI